MKIRRGFTLIEIMISLAVLGAAVALVLVYHIKAESSERVSGTVSAMINMTSKIKAYYASAGSFNGLTPVQVISIGLVTQPMTSDGSIYDAWGNRMTVDGNAPGAAPSFAITLGAGMVNPFMNPIPLSAEECVSLATKLANGADVVTVGAYSALTVRNGLVGGGKTYKTAANVFSMANLIDAAGCGTANPTIALQYH